MTESKSFYSKLLLFGEYSLISGSRAFALPLRNYSGRLKTAGRPAKDSGGLDGFADYLDDSGIRALFDMERLRCDIDNGLWFDSDIPHGYGVGSSAALSAALYDEYAFSPGKMDELAWLKEIFAAMESYYHGKSSGIDPLVSYTGKPLLFNSPEDITVISDSGFFDGTGIKPYLYDSETTAATSPLVKHYMAELENLDYSSRIEFRYIPVVDACIHKLLSHDSDGLWGSLMKLSELQLELFDPMIPSVMVSIWEKGLSSGKFCFKLCGSGGGGYFLAFSEGDVLLEAVDPQRVVEVVM